MQKIDLFQDSKEISKKTSFIQQSVETDESKINATSEEDSNNVDSASTALTEVNETTPQRLTRFSRLNLGDTKTEKKIAVKEHRNERAVASESKVSQQREVSISALLKFSACFLIQIYII